MSYRKIRIQGTLNLLRCAEKSTATTKLSTSYVTCHQRQQPHSQTLLLPIPPLCTVGWFNKTEFVVFWNQPIYLKKNIFFSKPPKVSKQKKEFLSLAILSLWPEVSSPCSSRSRRRGQKKLTVRRTLRLVDWISPVVIAIFKKKILNMYFCRYPVQPGPMLCKSWVDSLFSSISIYNSGDVVTSSSIYQKDTSTSLHPVYHQQDCSC